MPIVGEQLRLAREEQNLSVEQVADMTKIRGDHIRALEEGNYEVFSAPVYIRGFVRTYSTLLKLDTTLLLQQLGRELAESGQVDPMLTPESRGVVDATMFQLSRFSRRMLWPVLGVGVLVVFAAVAYFVMNHGKDRDPTVGLGDGLYQSPSNSGETLPVPTPH
ncbi:MAG TPA: helix-turn-helix transcriptional regulator [Verrucomicrobiae bacterium]|jgi:cytoskeleton protein RodZ